MSFRFLAVSLVFLLPLLHFSLPVGNGELRLPVFSSLGMKAGIHPFYCNLSAFLQYVRVNFPLAVLLAVEMSV